MLYSHTCAYALRALIHLAEHPEGFVLSERIARAEAIPHPFLKKIAPSLVKAGLLRSARGPHGGLQLARPPEEITLFEIRGAVDGNADLERCVFHLGPCREDRPCPHHAGWKELRERIAAYLQETSVWDLAQALKDAPARGKAGEHESMPENKRSRIHQAEP